MKKKLVQFDDGDHVDDHTKRNKIKRRKATPYASKFVKPTAAVSLKPQVLFETDDANVEQNVQSKSKIRRQATPYHLNKKSPGNFDGLRRDLFSVNMDKSTSSPKKSTSKKFKTHTSSNTSMEVQEIICDETNNSMTLEFADYSSEGSDVFIPLVENSKFNGSYDKIKPSRRNKIKRKKKFSESEAAKRLSLSSSSPANLEVTVDPIPPVEDESPTEELNSEQFFEDTDLNIEASSEGEDNMEVENLQEPSKNFTKAYTCFTYDDVNFAILTPNRKLYLSGVVSVTVLHGSVEVLGYTLTSASGSQNVYSPRGTSHLYFEAKSCLENQYENGFMNKIGKLIPKEELTVFKKYAKINSCILMYKKLEQQEIKFVQKHIAQAVFPEKIAFRETKGDWNVLNVNPAWDELADSMIFNSKLLLTGGRGVGKSTMLRYILNKLLLKYTSVVVIDLDPGQPEFTLPGCVSFHIITEPIFGPNYTHQRTPYRSVFVSDLNVSTMPKHYLDRIDDLYKTGATEAGFPTIINYVGLTRENGLDLLSSVISIVKPSIVVEIRIDNESRNFVQQLSRDLLANSQLYSSSRYFTNEEFPKFKIEIISSERKPSRGWVMSPRNVREMKILNYFGKIFSEDDLNLESTAEFVYKINISNIKLRSQYKECKINLIDQSLVAMCSDTGECYGWGIVCTVDIEQNKLYIQTPMPSCHLSLVSVLNKGTVSLPPCFYMAYNYPNIPNKYVCGGIVEDTGRLPMRSFLPASQYHL